MIKRRKRLSGLDFPSLSLKFYGNNEIHLVKYFIYIKSK
jgi:hypothetical protein